MFEAVRGLFHFPDSAVVPGKGTRALTQEEISVLPSILGPVSDPDTDSTARIDRAGYVYLWEPDESSGLWVQAGYLRNGAQRFGQPVDPNDIQWFNLAVFRKKVLEAKRRLGAARLPGQDDTWNAASEGGTPACSGNESDVDIL